MPSDTRHYGQFCGLAAALDMIGDRWTILILREFLVGPCRFRELSDNLPGIGPNLLSSRLKKLVGAGILVPAAVTGDRRGRQYELSPLGEELRTPILLLARWGLKILTDEDTGAITRPSWAILAVEAMVLGRRLPKGTHESYNFRVGDEHFHIDVEDGRPTVHRGMSEQASLEILTEPGTFVRIGAELLQPVTAVATGLMQLHGDADVVDRCSALLGLTGSPTPATELEAVGAAPGR